MAKKQINANYFDILIHTVNEDGTRTDSPFLQAGQLLSSINQLAKLERSMKLKQSKKCWLESFHTTQSGTIIGTFATAKSDYRPPVVDLRDLSQHDNPRTINEGDRQLIYFSIRTDSSSHPQLTIALQHSRHFTINTFIEYITKFFRQFYPQNSNQSFTFMAHMNNTFFTEMKRLASASSIEVIYTKESIADKFSWLSGFQAQCKREIKLSISRKGRMSLEELAISAANAAAGDGYQTMQDVLVRGKDINNNDTVINIKGRMRTASDKIDTIKETGELDTQAALAFIQKCIES